MRKSTCSWIGCNELLFSTTKRYCLSHHAEYMRTWRKTHPLSAEQKVKDIARSIANVYQKRGKLIPQPCEVCRTTEEVEKHHEDYSKPLVVRWLCRSCHLAEHRTFHESRAA